MKKDLMEFKTPYSKRNKFRRLVWNMVWTCFARPFPRSMAMGWKRMLLRAFGAKIAPTAVVYATTARAAQTTPAPTVTPCPIKASAHTQALSSITIEASV